MSADDGDSLWCVIDVSASGAITYNGKDIMIAFLTDLLNPASPIEDVIFLDKEMEADGEDMRSVIYDLRCKTQDGLRCRIKDRSITFPGTAAYLQ